MGARTDVAVDEGLRAYMLRVYNYMAGGVFLTGIVAYLTSQAAMTRGPTGARQLTEFGQLIYVSPLKWVIMLAPLAFVFFLSFRIYKMSVPAAQLAFWAFAGVMGLSLSSIFLVYTGRVDLAGVLRHSGGFRRPQPIRLYDQEGPICLGHVPLHGR